MDFTTLGRTGLRVSVVGLGGGGPSRLGQRTGKSEAESVRLVKTALDLGINFLDTAEGYGTETIIGKAIRDVDRDRIVISTKKGARTDDRLVSGREFAAGVDASLQRLGIETIDIMHIHGLRDNQIDHAYAEILPALDSLRDQGKVRFFGVTESFESDTDHRMLKRVLKDDYFDVMMVGFNMLNQTARTSVFPTTQARGIGVLDMFAVRRAFSRPDRLQEILDDLAARAEIESELAEADDPLGFLVTEGGAESIMDAAYRYCRHEAGVDLVLTGTGSEEHLRANVASILRPPLAPDAVEQINRLFDRVVSTSGS